ncbi:MAG: NUDIX hydrolase [Candidatus Neomarinimicrobiota bacterium]
MNDKHLHEETLASQLIFKGHLLEIYSDQVRLPDGSTSTREYTRHPGAVALVPILPDGRIVLIRQYRYPVRKVMIELPAGKLDPGEDYLTAAHRELIEEIGYSVGRLTLLGEIDPCVGYSDEHMWICLADELTATENNLDHDEFIELYPVPLETAVTMATNGTITDVKTIIGILWTQRRLSKRR